MKILITGGFGNLGSWLVRHFCSAGHEVSILARQRKSFLDAFPFEFIPCDIGSSASCEDALKGRSFDVVIHTASYNDTFLPQYNERALQINTLGTRNILQHLNKADLKNFIYLSTFHVYGASSGTITEKTPPQPIHDYATTHLFGEIYVEQFSRTHRLPYTIIRLTNSYGCPIDVHSDKWYLVLNDLARMAFEKQMIVLKSNGRPSRDFIWMGTVCKVFELIAQLDIAPRDVFNLSGEQSYTMLNIAQEVKIAYALYSGNEIEISVNENDTNDYPSDLLVDASKLKRIIPYEDTPVFQNEAIQIFNLLARNK
ncbi:MAG: NAD(P)-dependent oxidoreductase [Chitinophagales bacterium]|nr:NAD(P)-dependent oxidoreductase [Chitinophagales bacterium]